MKFLDTLRKLIAAKDNSNEDEVAFINFMEGRAAEIAAVVEAAENHRRAHGTYPYSGMEGIKACREQLYAALAALDLKT